MTLFDKCFITGCDENTEWMPPWFVENYKAHNDIPLVFADFGVSLELKNMLSHLGFDHVIDMRSTVADSTIGNPKKLVNAGNAILKYNKQGFDMKRLAKYWVEQSQQPGYQESIEELKKLAGIK